MYPIDRRKVALRVYGLLQSLRKTGNLLDVSHTTVARWLQQSDRKRYFRSAPKADVLVHSIKSLVESSPLISLRKLKLKIQEALNINLSKELVRTVLSKAGYKRKVARHYGRLMIFQNRKNNDKCTHVCPILCVMLTEISECWQ